MVMDTIKRNPVPAALAGAGLALLCDQPIEWQHHGNGGPCHSGVVTA